MFGFLGKGVRRRVLATSKIPGNWQSFLRLDDNKTELFRFLANFSMEISTEKIIVSTLDSSVLSKHPIDFSLVSPSDHEEADTRMLLHAKEASNSGMKKISIRTVDTDVVVIATGMFTKLELDELWISFGTGKNFRNIPIHCIVRDLGKERSECLPLFHAFTGCDQVSFFAGRGKKNAWSTWNQFGELTTTLSTIMKVPSVSVLTDNFSTIERFVVLMYDRTSTSTSVNELRKILFARKGRSIEGIPPTADALFQHSKRAIYQGAFCWGQSLSKEQHLPNPVDWGWKSSKDGFEVEWITIAEASSVCKELIRCGCNVEKGCHGRCKCQKASLKCTELCKCGGDCEETV